VCLATWYQTLLKPAFTPPDWLFAPVWTVLYVAIAVAGWRIWMKPGHPGTRFAMAAYSAQLVLNLAWSFIFFGHHLIAAALADILALLAAICVNVVLFWRIDRAAGWLLVPYAAWVTYATALNAALWRLN
jgi:benzodiazapine receptor